MQQRYCSCGHLIWVEYLLPNMDPKVIFRSTNHSLAVRLTCCPFCKRHLAIDELG